MPLPRTEKKRKEKREKEIFLIENSLLDKEAPSENED